MPRTFLPVVPRNLDIAGVNLYLLKMKLFLFTAMLFVSAWSIHQFRLGQTSNITSNSSISGKCKAQSIPLCAALCLNINCFYFTFNNKMCEFYALQPSNNVQYWRRTIIQLTTQTSPSTTPSPVTVPSTVNATNGLVFTTCPNYTCLWKTWFGIISSTFTFKNTPLDVNQCAGICRQYGSCSAFTYEHTNGLTETKTCYVYSVIDSLQMVGLVDYPSSLNNATTCLCQVYPSSLSFYPICKNMTGNYSLTLGTFPNMNFVCRCARQFLTTSLDTYTMPKNLTPTFESCVALCFDPKWCWGVSYQEVNRICQIAEKAIKLETIGSLTINCVRV